MGYLFDVKLTGFHALDVAGSGNNVHVSLPVTFENLEGKMVCFVINTWALRSYSQKYARYYSLDPETLEAYFALAGESPFATLVDYIPYSTFWPGKSVDAMEFSSSSVYASLRIVKSI